MKNLLGNQGHISEGQHNEKENSLETPSPYSMTEEILQHRLTKRMEFGGRKITQIYACLVVSVGHFTFGTCLGWASPMIFRQFNYTTTSYTSKHGKDDFADLYTWMTSMVPLGASVGFGLWTIVGYKKGPRKTLLILSVFYFILTVLLLLTRPTPQVLVAGRFFLGFFGICYIVCGQMLMTDTIHAVLLQYTRIPPQIAILVGLCIIQASGIDDQGYTVACICIGITVAAFLMLLVMPESPVHLFQRGEKLAERSLQWYIGKSGISYTMRRIRKEYAYRRTGLDQSMLNMPVIRKTILILIGVVILQIGSGYYMYLFYGTFLWSKVPLMGPYLDVLILGCVLTFSRVFWMLVHLKMNIPMRQPMMISCTMVGTSQLAMASILYVRNMELCKDTDFVKWTCFVCIFFMVFSFESGLNRYTGTLVYMYLPVQIYHTGLTIVHVVFWFVVFVTIKGNGLWHSFLPSWQLFLIMSIFSLLGTIYVYVFVVEIFNKSLVQIQLDIGGSPVGNRGSLFERTGGEDV